MAHPDPALPPPIDPASGAFHIGGIAEPIGPHTTHRRFLSLTGLTRVRGEYASYALGVREIGGRRCYVVVQFHGDAIETIEVALVGEAEDEATLHEAHRAWLRELLGTPAPGGNPRYEHHAFAMGGVGAVDNPRDFSATIVARYRWAGRPWQPS